MCLMWDDEPREGLSQLKWRQCRRPEAEPRNEVSAFAKPLPCIQEPLAPPQPLNLSELQFPLQELPTKCHQLWGMGVETPWTGVDSAWSSALSRAWHLPAGCRGGIFGWLIHPLLFVCQATPEHHQMHRTPEDWGLYRRQEFTR